MIHFIFDTTAEMEEIFQSGNVDDVAASSLRKQTMSVSWINLTAAISKSWLKKVIQNC